MPFCGVCQSQLIPVGNVTPMTIYACYIPWHNQDLAGMPPQG
jgi:hypothetical protein